MTACINGASGVTTGTVAVNSGGTGVATFANTSALVTTGTTSTGAVQNIASVATGQLLTSAGTSTLPSWSASPTITSITFGAGNALNTYSEGTWTPVLTFGGGVTGITYTTQVGTYTRIGRLVVAQFSIQLTSKGSSTGAALITGLPFTSITTAGSANIAKARTDDVTFPVGAFSVGVELLPNTSSLIPQAYKTSAATINLDDTQFANDSLIEATMVYFGQ